MDFNSAILAIVTNLVSSILYDTTKKHRRSDIDKQIDEAFTLALNNYYPKNDSKKEQIEREIKQSVVQSAGFTNSSLDKQEVFKEHPSFFEEFEKVLASKQVVYNYIIEKRNQARHAELLKQFSPEQKKELVKPLEDQIAHIEKSLSGSSKNEKLIISLISLQNKISLTLENWDIIVQSLVDNTTLDDLFEKVAKLFLKGEFEVIIQSIQDSLFDKIEYSVNETDSKERIILDLLVIKANVYELLDKPNNAGSLYTKIIVEFPPKNLKHYTKAQLHFFNNQEHTLFHHSIFKQIEFSENSFSSESNELEHSIERAIVFNCYNKMLYQNQQAYFIDSKERTFSIVEENLMTCLIPLSNSGLSHLYFNYYWDSYRIIRYTVQSFDYLFSHFENLKNDFRELNFDKSLGIEIGYYAYSKLFYFEAKIYQRTKDSAFLGDHIQAFNKIENLNEINNFGEYLSFSNFGLLSSVFAILEGDFRTAQQFILDFSIPLLDKVTSPNGISIDKKKILFWEYYYGQMLFIELGLKIVSTIKEYEVLLSHSQSMMHSILSLPMPFRYASRSFEISNRAILLQAKIRIQIYELTKKTHELDMAISSLIMSQTKQENMHLEGRHLYVTSYVLFKIWEKKFPEMYEIEIFKGKDIMGEDNKQKAIDIWKNSSDSDRLRLVCEFPDFSFDQFKLKPVD